MLFDVDNLYAGARQAQTEGRTREAAEAALAKSKGTDQ